MDGWMDGGDWRRRRRRRVLRSISSDASRLCIWLVLGMAPNLLPGGFRHSNATVPTGSRYRDGKRRTRIEEIGWMDGGYCRRRGLRSISSDASRLCIWLVLG